MKKVSFLTRVKRSGFTVAESVIALGIGAVAVVGGMTLSQQEMRLVKSIRQTNAASHSLEERIEQLRLINWRQMTDADHLIKYYFPKKPSSGLGLPSLRERVTVSAYPDAEACTPLIVETDASGNPQIVSAGAGFDQEHLARVNVRVTWTGTDGKVRVRELASIISNAGINVNSLPPWGTESTGSSSTGSTGTGSTGSTGDTGSTGSTGDTSTGSTGSTGGTSGGSTGSTDSGSTGSSGSGTSTGSTGSTTGNNGNGNGRGNAGGQSGKK